MTSGLRDYREKTEQPGRTPRCVRKPRGHTGRDREFRGEVPSVSQSGRETRLSLRSPSGAQSDRDGNYCETGTHTRSPYYRLPRASPVSSLSGHPETSRDLGANRGPHTTVSAEVLPPRARSRQLPRTTPEETGKTNTAPDPLRHHHQNRHRLDVRSDQDRIVPHSKLVRLLDDYLGRA